MKLIKKTLEGIGAPNLKAMDLTREKWDKMLKPLGSLGKLEEVTIKIAGIMGKSHNRIDKKAIVVMSSDNGVVEEGVSAAPQFFTRVLTESMPKGITGVATLGKFTNTDIITVDLGVIGEIEDPRVINRKISHGTRNFTKGPAMTYEQAVKSIEIGIELGDRLYGEGYDILGTGEIGIGNTTSSAAVLSVLANLEVDITCGKGAGLTEEQYINKKSVIIKGIETNKPNREDPIDVISKLGGYDIGGMCGLFLSAAKNKRPIVADGFISTVAALCAVKLSPLVKEYIIASHLSAEPGAIQVMEELGLSPMLNLDMRLGEGSGCPLAFQIIEAGLYSLENMATFEEVALSDETLVDIRKE
ncbi:MAG: nicotinate-nucleotide--dimethylbenzimidazole phosphoribosyltransferase [Tissierellaceae bacterium]